MNINCSFIDFKTRQSNLFYIQNVSHNEKCFESSHMMAAHALNKFIGLLSTVVKITEIEYVCDEESQKSCTKERIKISID